MLTVGSLFSGIGGIDLGLERAGMHVIWQSEIDPYASRVLAKHWPDVPNLGDVTKIDWENDGLDYGDGIARSLHVDLIAGGFPCQPVSLAGRGLAQRDERWLWPAFARCVRSLRPRYVLVENVPGLLVRGMGDVLGDLAACGYDCEWTGIPAAAVGAAHLRWRIFVVAHARCDHVADAPVEGLEGTYRKPNRVRSRSAVGSGSGAKNVGDPEGFSVGAGLRETGPGRERRRRSSDAGWWATEPDVGRVAHGIPARVERLKCLGNAVVPQVAEYVGRQLLAHIDGCQDGAP